MFQSENNYFEICKQVWNFIKIKFISYFSGCIAERTKTNKIVSKLSKAKGEFQLSLVISHTNAVQRSSLYSEFSFNMFIAFEEKSQQYTWILLLVLCDNIGKTELPTPQPTSNTQLNLSSFLEVISGNSVKSQHLFLKNLNNKI